MTHRLAILPLMEKQALPISRTADKRKTARIQNPINRRGLIATQILNSASNHLRLRPSPNRSQSPPLLQSRKAPIPVMTGQLAVLPLMEKQARPINLAVNKRKTDKIQSPISLLLQSNLRTLSNLKRPSSKPPLSQGPVEMLRPKSTAPWKEQQNR
jgi:hypothetical protein